MSSTTARYGFLLMPDYSMMAFTAAIDQMRMANRLSGESLYEWVVLGESDRPVNASTGLSINSMSMMDTDRLEAVFVCGGLDIETKANKTVTNWLRRQAKKDVQIGAICTGTYILAHAGLLNGYRCTIHWENLAGLRARFPNLIISHELFEIDRDRFTCAGGSSAVDMMVYLIAQKHGWALASDIAEEFLVERIRGKNDRQRFPLRLHLGGNQPKLGKAISYMEANLDEPLGLDEISGYVGLSRRQLERLFQKHLKCVPTRYYMHLRLRHARQLLLRTDMMIADIAMSSGFVSTPHFSKSYRTFFGIPPSDERKACYRLG